MTIFGLPLYLHNAGDNREWYEEETILVDKNGLSGNVTLVESGGFEDITILVDKDGLSGTTTEITI